MSNGDTPGFHGIYTLKCKIDFVLGKDTWFDYEVETIISELNLPFYSKSLGDKIYLLKTLGMRPEVFHEDFWFTMVATDVINGNIADFTQVPHVTSLELAYAILQVQMSLSTSGVISRYSDGFIEGVAYILRNEGYSEPVAPFSFVPKEMLSPGQTKEDTDNKATAIQLYIKGMSND